MSTEKEPPAPDGDVMLELDPLDGLDRYVEQARCGAAKENADRAAHKFFDRDVLAAHIVEPASTIIIIKKSEKRR